MGSAKAWKAGFAVLAVIAVLAIGLAFFRGGEVQTLAVTTPSGEKVTSVQPITVINPQCGYDGLTPTFSAFDVFNKGTSVGATVYVKQENSDRFVSGVTELSPDSTVDLLFVNKSVNGFHSVLQEGVKVPCSSVKAFNAYLYENATITPKVFNTEGDLLDNAGAGTKVNETGATAGKSYTHKIALEGEEEASSNDMVVLFEASGKDNVSDIILTGFNAKKINSVPRFYSVASGTSEVWVYEIEPVTDAVTKEGSIRVLSESGSSMAGQNITMTLFTKEWFLAADGEPTYAIEDLSAVGNSPQYMGRYAFTWYYKA